MQACSAILDVVDAEVRREKEIRGKLGKIMSGEKRKKAERKSGVDT